MEAFKGRLRACYGDDGLIMQNIDEIYCVDHGGVWRNGFISFDKMSDCFLVLMEISSLEMWPDLMYQVCDSTAPGLAPKRDTIKSAALFFIAYIIIGSFFLIGLIVGVVVDEYKHMHAKLTGSYGLTTAQKQYLLAYKEMIYNPPEVKLRKPKKVCCKADEVVRTAMYDLVTNPKFELSIMILIILNIGIMCVTYYGQSTKEEQFIDTINDVFTFVFLAECLAKWGGLGLAQLVRSGWNRFDIFIVTVSIFVFLLRLLNVSLGGPNATLLRVFRVLRLFRLVNKAKGLKQLIQTLIFSLSALWNMSILLFLILFIFAVMGVSLFGDIPLTNVPNTELNQHANFQTFGTAWLTLFRMCTGENWNALMHNCAQCKGDTCADPLVVYVYFVAFYIVSAILILNIFIAVILKNFEEEVNKDPALTTTPITRQRIIDFGILWTRFATTSHPFTLDLPSIGVFLNLLPQPIGLGTPLPKAKMIMFIDRLDLPQLDGRVHYLDVCLSLSQRLFEAIDPAVSSIPLDNQLLRAIKLQVFRTFPELKRVRAYNFSAGELAAVLRLQKRWRMKIKAKGGLGESGHKRRKTRRLFAAASSRLGAINRLVGYRKNRAGEENSSQKLLQPSISPQTSEVNLHTARSMGDNEQQQQQQNKGSPAPKSIIKKIKSYKSEDDKTTVARGATFMKELKGHVDADENMERENSFSENDHHEEIEPIYEDVGNFENEPLKLVLDVGNTKGGGEGGEGGGPGGDTRSLEADLSESARREKAQRLIRKQLTAPVSGRESPPNQPRPRNNSDAVQKDSSRASDNDHDAVVGPVDELRRMQEHQPLVPQQQAQEALFVFLRDMGFEEYAPRFREQKLCMEDLHLLTAADLSFIIPHLGPRVRFQQMLKKQRSSDSGSGRGENADVPLSR